MKLFATMILIASSVATFAYGKTKTVTSYSTIAMGPGVLTYDQLCLNSANQLETIEPKEICVEYKQTRSRNNDRRVCVRKEAQIFTKDLEYTKKVCVSGRNRDNKCRRYEMQTAFHNTYFDKKVTLYRWQGSHRDGSWGFGKVLSSERFDVPACK